MKRDKLQSLLNKNPVERGIFSPSELDEVILTVYNMINWAIRDQCDVIEVRDKEVVWYKAKDLFDQMPTPFDFKPTFEMIRKRDQVIQPYLKPVIEDDDKTVYKFILD